SCAAPSAKGDDKFITTDYLQQCPKRSMLFLLTRSPIYFSFQIRVLGESYQIALAV
ncbi:integrase, partial [Escherichia coli]